MSRPHPREVVTTQALSIWVAAMAVYIVAITGRTSFGVAGLEAIDRFGVDGSRIAVFTAVQLGVYALAQIPTGMAIDRFGPRRLLVVGALVMGLGQVTLGLTTNYWVAIGARVLIGAGDATAFLSVMRILPYWFPLHKTPMFTQVTAALGQMGQFLSAVPFLALLGASGWTIAFVSLGAAGLLVALAAGVAVSDSPEQAGVIAAPAEAANDQSLGIVKQLRLVFRSPVAWQAFFIHFIGLLPINVFVLLWGMPLMTTGLGIEPGPAGWVLTAMSGFLMLVGPIHGQISSRARNVRAWFALAFTAIHLAGWSWFFTGPRGLGAMFVMATIMATCAPAANYGFDIVRENLDRSVVATATGLGNMGGFVSSMTAAQAFGIVLDHSGHAPHYGFADFRLAAVSVAVVWAIGILGVIVTQILRRKAGPSAPTSQVVEIKRP